MGIIAPKQENASDAAEIVLSKTHQTLPKPAEMPLPKPPKTFQTNMAWFETGTKQDSI